ncbi:MAG: porin [Neorhizobium sp.]|nr:porin [Neorhizobium sp.]
MNIKSLLLGSAAALAAVTGAQAADAIVAASPEPMEYVRVCDAFGTGYFYIPGTETCLKIGGYVRFQTNYNSNGQTLGGDREWDSRTRGYINFQTKSDTEYGALGSFIALRTWAESDYAGGSVEIDEAYLTLGGFTAGYKYNYWDAGLSGETDALGSNRVNTIGYEYTGSGFKAGLFVDELSGYQSDSTFTGYRSAAGTTNYSRNDSVGIEGQISGTFGPVSVALLGGYDFAADNGAIRGIATADIGPGTLGIAGIYSSGPNAYYFLSEWTVAAQYAVKLTDKFSITPGFQYWGKMDYSGDDFVGSRDAWRAGVTLDYKIVDGLTAKVSAQYTSVDGARTSVAAHDQDVWTGFVRLQRTF